MFRIMSIDPGSKNIGISILCFHYSECFLEYAEFIKLDDYQWKNNKMLECLIRILYITEIYSPQKIIIETMFISDKKSLLILEFIRGGISLSIWGIGFSTIYFAPALVKKIITGAGHSSKEFVEKKVCNLLQLEKHIPEDMSDCISLCVAYVIIFQLYFFIKY